MVACMCRGASAADDCGCGFGQSWLSQRFECTVHDFVYVVNSNEEECCRWGGKPYCMCEDTGQPTVKQYGGCYITDAAYAYDLQGAAKTFKTRAWCLQYRKDKPL